MCVAIATWSETAATWVFGVTTWFQAVTSCFSHLFVYPRNERVEERQFGAHAERGVSQNLPDFFVAQKHEEILAQEFLEAKFQHEHDLGLWENTVGCLKNYKYLETEF